MHQFSDSDTPDSDEGIRFKTDSTRNKDSNRKVIDTCRDRKRSKSRSRSLERRRNRRKRDDERNRDVRREKYRRRSYSRERRDKRSTRSKDRSSKYDRLTAKCDRDRSKRSASAELKSDASGSKRRLKDSSITKREIKSKSQDLDVNRPSSDCKGKTTKSDVKCNTSNADDCLDSPANDNLEAFGPALPPNLLNRCNDRQSLANFDGDTSLSPQCRNELKDSNECSFAEDDFNNSGTKRGVRACSKVSTSPVSSEDHDLVPVDDVVEDDETYRPVFADLKQFEHKDIIEIEDSDVESEKISVQAELKPNNSSFDNNCVRLKDTADAEKPCQSIGPFLPQHLREHLHENAEENGNTNISLSDDDGDDEIEEGEIVGPILPGSKCSFSAVQIALEERALQYKIEGLIKDNCASDVNSREDWMVSLPEAKTAAQIGLAGLGPRQFRAKSGPDLSDRSGWTETPKETESKRRSAKEDNGSIVNLQADRLEIDERNKEQERLARKHHRKHRKKDKSLLEMHQDTLKIKKTSDDGQKIRRPFNRDVDLKVNQFDDAQKKAIYKKAQLLDDRFSKGESKYL